MGLLGGVKCAGLCLALLLALNVVSALDLSRHSRRESEWEIERYGRRGGSRERERRHRRHGLRREGEGERELRLEEPREWFRSEGGDVRVWDDIRAIEDADVYVRSARITLRERGLALPKYTDAACIGYVEEGEGLVGFLSGYSLGETVKLVRRGDVVAFPRGVAHWWYNSGNQELRILGFADTSAGLVPGEITLFSLVGGRGREEGGRRHGREGQQEELGGLLHGFSREFLAEAWNVDEREVEELLDSQREVGIVRAEREIDVSEFPGSSRRRRDADVVDEETANSGAYQAGWGRERPFSRQQIGDFPADFVYNVREGTPDVRVEEAGHATVVNRHKLPLLAYVKLGLSHTHLERNAILAPHWSPTGHRVVHVLRGDGHLEIAGQSGRRLVSTRIREGDAYVIPRFFPAGIRAGESDLEFISFYTTDVPYIEALAGKTSVLHNLPVQVAAAAFNIDEEKVRECRRKRARHAILLPPARHQSGRRDEGATGLVDASL